MGVAAPTAPAIRAARQRRRGVGRQRLVFPGSPLVAAQLRRREDPVVNVTAAHGTDSTGHRFVPLGSGAKGGIRRLGRSVTFCVRQPCYCISINDAASRGNPVYF